MVKESMHTPKICIIRHFDAMAFEDAVNDALERISRYRLVKNISIKQYTVTDGKTPNFMAVIEYVELRDTAPYLVSGAEEEIGHLDPMR